MKKILSIASNTVRESTRDRVFYSLLLFAVFLMLFAIVLGNLTLTTPLKIIQDFGLGAISIVGTLIAIFVGIGMVYKEIDKRTIYTILSKPIHRWQFLVGKYLGLCLTIVVEIVSMSILVFALCYYYVPEIPFRLVYAIVPIFFELLLILAFAFLFSSFSSAILSGMFTLCIFVIGHFTGDLKLLADNTDNPGFQKITWFLFYFLPNLEVLNYKTEVVHNLPISMEKFWFSITYSVAYTVMILLIAIFIFSRRDIK